MKNTILTLILTLFFIGCNNSATNEPPTPPTKIVGSYIQKGPFSLDTDVLAQVLDKDLKVLRDLPQARIVDYSGKYELNLTSIDTSSEDKYIEVSIDGYFFNEVSGKLSDDKLKLRGFGLAEKDKLNINVNVLTHITSDRIKEIIKTGKSFEEASLQAKNEILTIFNIPESNWSEYENFNSANIFGSTKSDAFLLAASVIFIGNNSKTTSEIAELLNDFSLDFKDNGLIDRTELLTKVLNGKTRSDKSIDSILWYLLTYADSKGLTFTYPDIKHYFNITYDSHSKFTSLVENGNFTLGMNGWSVNFNNGASGSTAIKNYELIIKTDNSGVSNDSISIVTTSNLNLQDGKTYSIMIKAFTSDPANKMRFAVEGNDGGNIISYSEGWSEVNIDNRKTNKIFTYSAGTATPYLSINLGNGLTKPGTQTSIVSCHIAEVEKMDIGTLADWNSWKIAPADGDLLTNELDHNKWTYTVHHTGNSDNIHHDLQMYSKDMDYYINGDSYQLFFTGKTSIGNYKVRTDLLSWSDDDTIWIDHISSYSSFFELTPVEAVYSTVPFTISNLQNNGTRIVFNFSGINFSAAGAIYQFSDISLYKFK